MRCTNLPTSAATAERLLLVTLLSIAAFDPGSQDADMFCVDEATAESIRRVFDQEGELSAIIELRRHFPLISEYENARRCVRAIAGWQPLPTPAKPAGKVVPMRTRRPRATGK